MPVVSSVVVSVVSVVSSVYARASVATSDERKRVLSILEFMFALSAKFLVIFILTKSYKFEI